MSLNSVLLGTNQVGTNQDTVRITSFTEKALLHPNVLKILCPPKCDIQKIKTASVSVLENVDTLASFYRTKLNKSLPIKLTEPLRAVTRVIYTIIVGMTASPLGILYHGGATLKNLGSYTIAKYKKDEIADAKWEKTAGHVQAFATDLFCTIRILGAAFLMTYTAILFTASAMIYKIHPSFSFVVCVVAASIFKGLADTLGASNPDQSIPALIAEREIRASMYFALVMRNQLGIVDTNGSLLPFSKDDKLDGKYLDDAGTERLISLRVQAQHRFEKLLDEIKRLGKKIEWKASLTPYVAAIQFRNDVKINDQNREDVSEIIDQLYTLDHVFTTLRDLDYVSKDRMIDLSFSGAVI